MAGLTRVLAVTMNGKLDVCMVAIAQLAEHLVVAQEAVGSSPTGHPPEWLKAQIREQARIAGFFCFVRLLPHGGKASRFRRGMPMGNVLVLNASYEPLSVVSVKRAIILLLKEKAELIEAAEAYLRAERRSFRVPVVIRLITYVRIPRHMPLPLSRRTIIARDRYTCQYCGCQFGRGELTLDHVIPRSRGGETAWDNVVAACRTCNQRKGNRTPDEAGYALLSVPRRPHYVALTLLNEYGPSQHNAWQKYLY